MADGWEILDTPPIIRHSSKGEADDISNEIIDQEEDLCGYLLKYGAKGFVKTWKKRWFVYEPRRCYLYYYRTQQDAEPLGSIDISNASFSYVPEEKSQFVIRTGDRSYLLQANDKGSRLYWLQELQAKRRKFNRKTSACNTAVAGRPSSFVFQRPTSGLLASENNEEDKDDSPVQLLQPIGRPSSVGLSVTQDNTTTSSIPGFNLSFTNFPTEFRNWRKSGFGHKVRTGEPLTFPTKDEETTASGETMAKSLPDENVDKWMSKFSLARKPFNNSNPKVSVQKTVETCVLCEEKDAVITVLKEAVSVASNEVCTRDKVIGNLNEQVRNAVGESWKEKTSGEETEKDKAQYIEQLSRMIQALKEENEKLRIVNSENEDRKTELQEQLVVLREMIAERDKSLVTLTNKVYTLEHADDEVEAAEETVSTPSLDGPLPKEDDLESMIASLKETAKAFEEQNKFLNGEILELHCLRKNDEKRLKAGESEIADLHADLCKTKARYFWLLQEFSTPLREGDEANKHTYETVQHLLDEAISNDASREGPREPRLADKYGFYEIADTADEETLESLANTLDIWSEGAEFGSREMSVGVKWENYLLTQGKRGLVKSEELKALCRNGVPHEYRARAWCDLVNLYVRHEREMAGLGYYKKLLQDKKGVYTPAAKQIELDLLRTLPNNKYYDRPDSEGTSKLRNVLLAYSWHNPAIGYCQGLNRLGAIALLYLKEEDAFWALVAIVEHLMPKDYYSRTLIGAQTDQRVLRDLLDDKAPKLAAHFQTIGVDLSLLSFNWYLTVFVDIFPAELTLRVWDTFLYEGNKVLFRYALAVFKCFEEDLLKINEAGMAFNFFRKLPKARLNAYKIAGIAFHQLNPFPRRNIEIKRLHYRAILQTELEKFEDMRKDYVTHRASDVEQTESTFSEDED